MGQFIYGLECTCSCLEVSAEKQPSSKRCSTFDADVVLEDVQPLCNNELASRTRQYNMQQLIKRDNLRILVAQFANFGRMPALVIKR